jgi:hypothetical protein
MGKHILFKFDAIITWIPKKTDCVRIINTEALSCNNCCSGKAISIIYCERVFVDLGIKHAMRMRRITLSSVVCPPLQYVSTLFSKIIIEHKTCVLIFSTTFVWNISPLKNWARYDQKCVLVFKYSIRYSCQILVKLEFSHHIFEKYSNMSNFMKIRPVGAVLLYAVRRTDGPEETESGFLQFCERA